MAVFVDWKPKPTLRTFVKSIAQTAQAWLWSDNMLKGNIP